MIAGVRKEPEATRNIGGNWHSDHSFDPLPPLGAVLLARELPDYGGDTLFASMYAAYDALSDGLKQTLGELRAGHAQTRAYVGLPAERQVRAGEKAQVEREFAARAALHPGTPRPPRRGSRVLFANPPSAGRCDGGT